MVFAEELAGDSGVAFQPSACGIRLVFSHSEVIDRFVCLLTGALASPALSRMMAVPERIIYRQGEFLRPEVGVNRVGVCRGGRHPAEVRIDVLLSLEVFPVGCSMRTDDGHVVLGVQPLVAVFAGERLDILAELMERLELSLVIGHMPCDGVLHTVSPERCEYFVIVPYLLKESVGDGLFVISFGDASCGGTVEDSQGLPEDVPLDVVLDIESVEDCFQSLCQRFRTECYVMFCGVGETAASLARVGIEGVNLCDEGLIYSAPPSGAKPKKFFSRLVICPVSSSSRFGGLLRRSAVSCSNCALISSWRAFSAAF